MVVPHQGKSTVFRLHLPVKVIKGFGAILIVLLMLAVGTAMNYSQKIYVATLEKTELDTLRQTNMTQKKQIEDLAKQTNLLQEDMNRLGNLENEVRKIINVEDNTQTSRSANRPGFFNGKGGPSDKLQLYQIQIMLQDIQSKVKTREVNLANLRDNLLEKQEQKIHTPSIWPTSGDVTSRFGWRSAPFGGGSSDFHPGLDIANEVGTPIMAAADGVVVYSGWNSGYGKLLQIDHGNSIETLYGHCSELVAKVGQKVRKGELIAYMGSTGYSTGSHLHYEVRVNQTAVNPVTFLNN